jgi:predicted ATPase with chaperone activity
LEDLALKVVFMDGELSLLEWASRMRLSLGVVEEIFQRLRKDQLIEVRGMAGGVHRVSTTSEGKNRAMELLLQNQYVGPAPVGLANYVAGVRSQSICGAPIRPEEVEGCFSKLVLSPLALKQIGTAIASGQSLFLHGPAGTGKTAIAETLPSVFEDAVWIPHAIEVEGQVITVFDGMTHEKLEQPPEDETDTRFVLCRRPRIIVGGELTIEMLELQFHPVAKYYEAPIQIKANNGVLIIDDFGRQRIRPEELLNRWIVPLDRRIDFLTLTGGKKLELPFDLFVVFATNLDPSKLADDAFLRRIPNKIRVDFATRKQFHEIFRRVCQANSLQYHEKVVDEVIDILKNLGEPLRPCYPRDLVRQICWVARYEGKEPKVDRFALAQACHNYFLNSVTPS